MKTPDPNAKAPRPTHISSDDERKPDMDHAPAETRGDQTAFDRGTAEADRIAREGTLPGRDDTGQNIGGANRGAESRASRATGAAKSADADKDNAGNKP